VSRETSKINYEPSDIISLDIHTRFHPELSWGQKIFLAEIEEQSKRGRFYYHKTSLAKFFGVAGVTICYWVKDLNNRGLVEVLFDPNDTICNTYLVRTSKRLND